MAHVHIECVEGLSHGARFGQMVLLFFITIQVILGRLTPSFLALLSLSQGRKRNKILVTRSCYYKSQQELSTGNDRSLSPGAHTRYSLFR